MQDALTSFFGDPHGGVGQGSGEPLTAGSTVSPDSSCRSPAVDARRPPAFHPGHFQDYNCSLPSFVGPGGGHGTAAFPGPFLPPSTLGFTDTFPDSTSGVNSLADSPGHAGHHQSTQGHTHSSVHHTHAHAGHFLDLAGGSSSLSGSEGSDHATRLPAPSITPMYPWMAIVGGSRDKH